MSGFWTASERHRIRAARQGFGRVTGWWMWYSLMRSGRVDNPRFVPLARIYLERQQRRWEWWLIRHLRWCYWAITVGFVANAAFRILRPTVRFDPAFGVVFALEAVIFGGLALKWPKIERVSRSRLQQADTVLASFGASQ